MPRRRAARAGRRRRVADRVAEQAAEQVHRRREQPDRDQQRPPQPRGGHPAHSARSARHRRAPGDESARTPAPAPGISAMHMHRFDRMHACDQADDIESTRIFLRVRRQRSGWRPPGRRSRRRCGSGRAGGDEFEDLERSGSVSCCGGCPRSATWTCSRRTRCGGSALAARQECAVRAADPVIGPQLVELAGRLLLCQTALLERALLPPGRQEYDGVTRLLCGRAW